jgi:serine/threonine protein kinase
MKDKLKSQASINSAVKTGGKSTTSTANGSSNKTNRDPDESFDFLAPPQNKDELGRLGNYRVLKVLGRGGMGVVFLAEDARLHRLVALKVMLPSAAMKKNARERFKREALITAKIEHDNIVTIYEVNEESSLPFLAMQFLKGMTLED